MARSILTTNVELVWLDDGRRKTLVPAGTSPRYLASGHVVFARRAEIFTVPFDIDRLEALGPAVRILGDAASNPVTRGAQFEVAADGQRPAVNVPTTTREAQRQARTIVFMQNFFDELRRRVAVRQ